jgi:hypothetical protein
VFFFFFNSDRQQCVRILREKDLQGDETVGLLQQQQCLYVQTAALSVKTTVAFSRQVSIGK